MSSEPSERSPYRRYRLLRRLLKRIKAEAICHETPFSILCYGSASYGFNPENPSKLDDLDLFMIVPTGICSDELMAAIKKLFPEGLTIKEGHIRHLLSGDCEMCRLYCQMEGVKIGFRLIHHHVLVGVSHPSGSEMRVRNIASVGQPRIVTDQEWSFALRGYVPVTYENYSEQVDDEHLLTVVQRVFSEGKTHLGAFGRKLLTTHVVYEAPGQKMSSIFRRIWSLFVGLSLGSHPEISDDDIINSIMRAEKFSERFRAKLRKATRLARS